MTQTRFEKTIKSWRTNDAHIGDAIHKHFTEVEPSLEDWIDVYTEGMRVWGLVFEEALDEFDLETDVLAGVAASAWNLALTQVVQALELSGVGQLEETLRGMRDAEA